MTALATKVGDAAALRHPLGLAHLINPVSRTEFLTRYWEREPLVVHRDDPTYAQNLLTLDQLDLILSTINVRSADLRVLDGGTETAVSRLIEEAGGGGNGLEALYDRYRGGATIAVNFVHERWEPIKELCQSLSLELSAQTQTNVYLTPAGGNQGLVPHHDTHDVFVVQVHGVKHWCLYPTQTELPLAGQRHRKTPEGAGPPMREFDLRPGDMLYMPRGVVHAATSKDTASCHLTIGVRPVTWAGLIKQAVERIVTEDVRFRRGLPPGFATDPAQHDGLVAAAGGLFDVIRAALDADELIASGRERAWLGRQPALRGHLLDIESLPSIGLDVWLSPRRDLLWRLDHDGDQVVLEFHGKRVRFPAHVEDTLRVLANSDAFQAADLPGSLDETGRLVLVRTLVREGFLTLA